MLLLFSLLLVNALLICAAFNPMLSNRAIRTTRSFLQCCAPQRNHQQLRSQPLIAHRCTESALYSTTPGTADNGAASDITKIDVSAATSNLKKLPKKGTKVIAAIPIVLTDGVVEGIKKPAKKAVKVKLTKISEMLEDAARYSL